MSEPALIDADCEATGHPTDCEEPATGTVVKVADNGITVTAGGTTKQVATIADADMDFPSHAHQYSDTNDDGTKECHDMQSHTIDPDQGEPSITINGSPIYVVENGVTTDPTTGGNVNIVSNPMTTGISQT